MILAAVLGLVVASGEFRHASATLTYLATPDRKRVLLAKLLAAAVIGAIFGLVAAAVSPSLGLAFTAGRGAPIVLGAAAMFSSRPSAPTSPTPPPPPSPGSNSAAPPSGPRTQSKGDQPSRSQPRQYC